MVVSHKFGLCFELVHIVGGLALWWSVRKKICRALVTEDCVSVVVLDVFDERDLP